MNPFTVEWLPEAEDELTRIWLQAADRKAVTAAQHQVDRFLSQNPQGHGRHLSEGLYQITCPPLTFAYTIDDGSRTVQVTWVHESG